MTPDSIREELEKILASPGFRTSDRMSRFLRFAVEEHLNGQTDKLKESFLGVELFGRKPSYDSRIDGVVRTEAVKLRARLKQYYETEGREDRTIIDMPKGGYVPVFRLRENQLQEAPAPPPEKRVAWWKPAAAVFAVLVFGITLYATMRDQLMPRAQAAEIPAIAVLPFADLSPHHDQGYFCDGMTEEIIDSLTKIGGFRVVASTSSFAFKGARQDIREIGGRLNAAYLVEGSVRKDGNLVRVTAQLDSAADGYHLWSESYERELKDVFEVQDEVSRAIVKHLREQGRGIPLD